jgi:hypothetical protein
MYIHRFTLIFSCTLFQLAPGFQCFIVPLCLALPAPLRFPQFRNILSSSDAKVVNDRSGSSPKEGKLDLGGRDIFFWGMIVRCKEICTFSRGRARDMYDLFKRNRYFVSRELSRRARWVYLADLMSWSPWDDGSLVPTISTTKGGNGKGQFFVHYMDHAFVPALNQPFPSEYSSFRKRVTWDLHDPTAFSWLSSWTIVYPDFAWTSAFWKFMHIAVYSVTCDLKRVLLCLQAMLVAVGNTSKNQMRQRDITVPLYFLQPCERA